MSCVETTMFRPTVFNRRYSLVLYSARDKHGYILVIFAKTEDTAVRCPHRKGYVSGGQQVGFTLHLKFHQENMNAKVRGYHEIYVCANF